MSPENRAKKEQEKDQADLAGEHFYKKNYDSSLQILNKLGHVHPNDAKIQHNKQIIHYTKAGYKNTEEFVNSLKEICRKSTVDVDSEKTTDDIEHTVMYYNHAVVLYHLRRYNKALQTLKCVEPTLESMDSMLARKYLLLLMDLYISINKPEKAIAVVPYLEKIDQADSKKNHSPVKCMKTVVTAQKLCSYLTLRSLKMCRKEMKVLSSLIPGNSPLISYMKANIEYIQGNFVNSCKILKSSSESAESSNYPADHWLSVKCFNNLAINFYNMRKPHLSTFYMKKALQKNEAIYKDMSGKASQAKIPCQSLQHIGVSKHYELLYNMGIQLLHCGQPQQAYDCLIEVVEFYTNNPRLWLRLAECCVMCHRQLDGSDSQVHQKSKVVQGSIGFGVHRKLILGSGQSYSQNSPSPSNGATLHMALSCLRNTLHLLTPESSANQKEGERETQKEVKTPAPPSSSLNSNEVMSVRCSAYTLAAYVSLEIQDYLLCVEYSEQLMTQNTATDAQKYCVRLYRSEALVALDKIADAVSYLNPDQVMSINCLRKTDSQELELKEHRIASSWFPKDLTHARSIMQYNLAVAHAMREQYEKAQQHLDMSIKSIPKPLPAQFFYLKLYLELMQGHRMVAQGIIKEHFGHVSSGKI